MNKESLISYVSKLCERHLQKKKAGGITLWALLSIAFFLTISITGELIDILSNKESRLLFIPVLTVCVNYGYFAFIGVLGIILLFTVTPLRSARSTIDILTMPIFSASFIVLLIFYGVMNFHSAFSAPNERTFLIFYLIGCFIFINIMGNLLQAAKNFILKKRKKYSLLEIKELIIYPKEYLRITAVILLLIAIIGLTVCTVVLHDIILLNSPQLKILLKVGIELFSLNVVFILMTHNIREQFRYEWIEKLERDIYLYNLSEDEIRRQLEDDIFSAKPVRWIKNQKDIIIGSLKENEKVLIACETELDEIGKSSISSKEKVDRAKDTYSKAKKEYNFHVNRYNLILGKLNKFLRSFVISAEEREEVNTLLLDLETSPVFTKIEQLIKSIDKKYKDLVD